MMDLCAPGGSHPGRRRPRRARRAARRSERQRPFRAGKATLAEELHRRLPDAIMFDPEDVRGMLWKQMRPNGDFQDLPS